MSSFVLAAAVLISSTTVEAVSAPKPKAAGKTRPAKIARLIKQLDAPRFEAREQAEKALIKLGKPAYSAVLKATKSPSTEVRVRAKRILAAISVLVRNFHFLELQKKANLKLTDSFHGYEGNNLKKLPQGEQVMGGVKFRIGKKMIQLASTRAPNWPAKATGIEVGKTASQIHFLHGTGWGSPNTIEDGTRIGSYVVHYADKSKQVIPIEYGKDVRDWWNWDDSKPCTRAKIVWRGSNPAADKFSDMGIPLRLYRMSWKNPHPEKTIASIDFISTNKTICAPFCVAVTVEQPSETKSGGSSNDK